VVGWADPEVYPLQKKRHSFEFLRTIAHLRPRTNTFGAVARVRNAVAFGHPSIFSGKRVPVCAYAHPDRKRLRGGGGDVPGDHPGPGIGTLERRKADYAQDFFGGPSHLTVSGQLEAEVYALAMGDVYTFGPTFRAENSNTSRHLAEFWMVEPEMAFCDLEGDVALAVDF
jgi:asparaginyl-tRNA synthetase